MPSFTRKDYAKLVKDQQKRRVKAREREVRQVAQAVAPMDKLTHSQEWDFFLSILQDEMNGMAAVLETLQDAANQDMSFEPHIMAARKAQIMKVATQRATLEQVIGLPKEIMEKGEDAKLALESIEDD